MGNPTSKPNQRQQYSEFMFLWPIFNKSRFNHQCSSGGLWMFLRMWPLWAFGCHCCEKEERAQLLSSFSLLLLCIHESTGKPKHNTRPCSIFIVSPSPPITSEVLTVLHSRAQVPLLPSFSDIIWFPPKKWKTRFCWAWRHIFISFSAQQDHFH